MSEFVNNRNAHDHGAEIFEGTVLAIEEERNPGFIEMYHVVIGQQQEPFEKIETLFALEKRLLEDSDDGV